MPHISTQRVLLTVSPSRENLAYIGNVEALGLELIRNGFNILSLHSQGNEPIHFILSGRKRHHAQQECLVLIEDVEDSPEKPELLGRTPYIDPPTFIFSPLIKLALCLNADAP